MFYQLLVIIIFWLVISPHCGYGYCIHYSLTTPGNWWIVQVVVRSGTILTYVALAWYHVLSRGTLWNGHDSTTTTHASTTSHITYTHVPSLCRMYVPIFFGLSRHRPKSLKTWSRLISVTLTARPNLNCTDLCRDARGRARTPVTRCAPFLSARTRCVCLFIPWVTLAPLLLAVSPCTGLSQVQLKTYSKKRSQGYPWYEETHACSRKGRGRSE